MSNLAATCQGSQYTDEDRRRALVEFSIIGHVPTVSINLNIPESTLKDWKRSEWWEEAYNDIRLQNKELIETKVTKLIVSGFDAMQDRMTNGDHHLTKDGDIVRVPVKLRDAATATGISFDKLRLLNNEPTSIKAESTDTRLNSLAEKVRELQAGSSKIIESTPIPQKDTSK